MRKGVLTVVRDCIETWLKRHAMCKTGTVRTRASHVSNFGTTSTMLKWAKNILYGSRLREVGINMRHNAMIGRRYQTMVASMVVRCCSWRISETQDSENFDHNANIKTLDRPATNINRNVLVSTPDLKVFCLIRHSRDNTNVTLQHEERSSQRIVLLVDLMSNIVTSWWNLCK